MKSIVIYDTGPGGHRVVSHGNGLAYEFVQQSAEPGELAVFLQGDDAETFRTDLEELEASRPTLPTRDVLRMIWADYAPIAEER